MASAILWRFLFQPDFGPINYVLRSLGVQTPPLWFSDARLAMPSLMIMTLWAAVGGSTMLIFLAGLQGVPQELHEAASIDGAGRWARFRNVTLPMITPTLFFNLVIGIIAALRTFTTAFVATNGGPNYATWFYILHLYQTAFQNFDFGYASALAWIFFIIVISPDPAEQLVLPALGLLRRGDARHERDRRRRPPPPAPAAAAAPTPSCADPRSPSARRGASARRGPERVLLYVAGLPGGLPLHGPLPVHRHLVAEVGGRDPGLPAHPLPGRAAVAATTWRSSASRACPTPASTPTRPSSPWPPPSGR